MTRLPVVGIGEDGWDGLGARARAVLGEARVVLGAPRQLALLPADLVRGEREAWPSPMMPRVEALAAALNAGDPAADWVVVLASGDPMLHGLGSTLARLVDPARLEVLPVPSAYSLACARLGWAQQEVPLVSLVADPERDMLAALAERGRAIVYVAGTSGARQLAARLRDAGLGAARLTILARLGGPGEHAIESVASVFDEDLDPLHLVAVDARELTAVADDADTAAGSTKMHGAASQDAADADRDDDDESSLAAGAPRLASTVPGLPDDTYGGDGQLTRADVRAVALAALAPAAGELLWDVGAGSGTIAIEWCRAAPGARAVAIEQRQDRCATVLANAAALVDGPARIDVIHGRVPAALDGLPAPHAIFLGGATSQPGLIDRCWEALLPGGRLVAAAVTLESERALADAAARLGGRLVRLEHSHAEALGSFTAWRPERPITQWSATKDPEPR